MRRWTILLAVLAVFVVAARAQSIDEEDEITDVAEGSADVRKPPFAVDDEDDDEEGSGQPPVITDDTTTTTRKQTKPPKLPKVTTKGKDIEDPVTKPADELDDVKGEKEKEKETEKDPNSTRKSLLNTTTIIIIVAVVAILIILIIVVIVILRRRSANKDRSKEGYQKGHQKA